MNARTKKLAAIGAAAVLGVAAIAGASYAGHRYGGHGMGFLDKGQLAVSAMEMFDSIDADSDGKLTQAEIDQARNDRHAAHDANGDGDLSLQEFAALWHETTQPLTVRAFQMLDTDGNAIISRAEFDRPLADIVRRLDRNGDGGLSMKDHRRHGRDWDDD